MTYKIEIPRLEFPLPHRTPTAAVAMLFSLVLVTVVVVGDTRPTTSHRLNQKLCNSTNYWSQQENFLSLDHAKLLDEATRISKTSDEKYPHFSRVSATSETRLKWTVVLHERFVGCVNLLGGSEIEQLFMVEYNI
ncbi:hypothetical protein V6N12_038550 [Hibiscus sabdariffa]|uniref:Uncharacterized protein n=1 Tax=Hibiscus sabdariffa TaxID=183260 RepID=A0ABR2B5R5_9ROSI